MTPADTSSALRLERAMKLPTPRPMTDAAGIVRLFFTDPVTGRALRSERWVRRTVPGKRRLSYTVVMWYIDEVAAWVDTMREDAA